VEVARTVGDYGLLADIEDKRAWALDFLGRHDAAHRAFQEAGLGHMTHYLCGKIFSLK
jgi:hypothetical protein